MLPYRRFDCPLQIVRTVFIVVVTATFDQERQPVGLEMCKDHCGKCNNCTFCVFLTKRLACIATWSKYPLQTNGEEAVLLDISKERLGSISQRKGICEDKESRIVFTRSNDFRCIKLRTEEKTSLLIAPRAITQIPLRVLNLLNSSITTYCHIKPPYVNAIAYVATIQHVLISTYMPKNILSFSLHTNVSVTVRRNISARAIAVDDAQHLVFLATWWPFACVTRMTPDGRYFKNITCQINSWVICVDTRRDLLYVSNKRAIYSFTYDGQGRQRIASTSHIVSTMTLSDNGDMIYYNDRTNIMELNLVRNGTKRKVTEKHIWVRNILYNEGFLYISSRKRKYIYVGHESNYSRLREAYYTGTVESMIALMP